MSNSQRRRAQRAAKKRHVGPHTPAVKQAQEWVADLGQRIHGVERAQKEALAQELRAQNAARPIPVSGSARRRAKAQRNRTAVQDEEKGNGDHAGCAQ